MRGAVVACSGLVCRKVSKLLGFLVIFQNRFYQNMFLPNAYPAENQFYWINFVCEETRKTEKKFRSDPEEPYPPVTISLSDRPGHFFSIKFLTRSASDHTTVSQIGFFHFFSKTFSTLNVSDHITVSQTGFKKTRSVRPW